MLDVDGGHHIDTGVEQVQHVLVALAVSRPRHVGMRQLIHDAGVGMPREDGIEVHLLKVTER